MKNLTQNFTTEYLNLINHENELNRLRNENDLRRGVMMIVLHNDKKEIVELEHSCDMSKILLLKHMATIAATIGKDIGLLESRICTLKSVNRAKFSQSKMIIPIKFACMNIDITWNDVKIVLTLTCHENLLFFPFDIDDIMLLASIFRDDDLVVIGFDTIFTLMRRTKSKLDPRAAAADKKLLRNIMLQNFPFLIITHNTKSMSWILPRLLIMPLRC